MCKYENAIGTQIIITQELEQKNDFDFVYKLTKKLGVNTTIEGFDILQELVDKATPIKVKTLNGVDYCEKCLYQIDDRNYDFCSHCGQALDWSNE